MAEINKRLNTQYNGGSPNIPLAIGDRYFGQDLVRDQWFMLHNSGLAIKNMCGTIPIIMSGGSVSKGTGNTLNISACTGYVYHQASIPDDFGAVQPPAVSLVDVIMQVASTAQTNLALPSAVLDDATTNYIKLRYKEDDGNTRTRAKASGTYAYEVTTGFEFTVDDTAPTIYDIVLGEFISVGNAVPSTIDLSNREISYLTGNVRTITSNTIPDGWLLCDGSAINRTTYQNLFSNIGVVWGVGDGSTTFGIPDFQGIFLRGAGINGTLLDALGVGFTGVLGTYQDDKGQGHKHSVTPTYGLELPGAYYWANSVDIALGVITVGNPITDGINGTPRTGSETNPANAGVNYIIKY